MTDKIITAGNKNRGLFLITREDYMEKIEHLARLITEKYPEIVDAVNVSEVYALYKTGSLHELVEYYETLYQKVKEINKPSYRPYWMFRTKFYS